MQKTKQRAKRILVAIIGGSVLLLGVVTIPYPGPGWLIVISGLAILSTEFAWAQRWLNFVKVRYEAWKTWVRRQSKYVQLLFFLFTSIVVILTIYLLNGYGFLNDLLKLNLDWLDSPLVFFK